MKYLQISTMVLFAFFNLQCTTTNKKNAIEKPNEIINKKENIQKITLEEITRGSRRSVEITDLSKNVEINGTNRSTKMRVEDWNTMQNTALKISLENINSYPSPTTERFHDGAMAATIKITSKDGKLYESQSFDTGKPPKELAALYNLLSSDFKN